MPKYEIYESGVYRVTLEAKTGDQAKRIYCKWRGVSPSDNWCGMSILNARKVKEVSPCK